MKAISTSEAFVVTSASVTAGTMTGAYLEWFSVWGQTVGYSLAFLTLLVAVRSNSLKKRDLDLREKQLEEKINGGNGESSTKTKA